MNRLIESIERRQLRTNLPQFKAGDTVRVHFQVIEGQRRRTQVFEGIVIKRQGPGIHESFTVRKQSFGVGVERTFPLHSPKIERIEVVAIGDVRRAKLYYLREKVGKRARVRTKAGAVLPVAGAIGPAAPAETAAAVSDDEMPDAQAGESAGGEPGGAASGDEVAAAHAQVDDGDGAGAGEPSAPGSESAPEVVRD